MPNLVWFRRDLRTYDNPALFEACQHSNSGVIALFIVTPKTWLKHAMSAIQVTFLLNHLHELSKRLESLNIPLLIREVPSFEESYQVIEELILTLNIEGLYFNRQYEFDEQRRDNAICAKLEGTGRDVHLYHDQVIIPPERICNQQQEPFKVFTPFKKKWLSTVEHYYKTPLLSPPMQLKLTTEPDKVPSQVMGFTPANMTHLPQPGEKAAIQKLTTFCNGPIQDYHTTRDFPALNATSHLSPYLALGILSPQQCITAVMQEQQLTLLDFFNPTGPGTWVNELIWREFYKMIVFYFPDVCKHKPFKLSTEKLNWNHDERLFTKWCQGQTGFPLVDAAMRQLQQTGWMHNRLRMVTAMFLSKILFIDWRLGERYFSEQLIDADFSANNGGWQWSASTGTDAVPYFRIFNPITQSERFDKNGDFIRTFCQELAALDSKTIHDPYANGKSPLALNYPEKIIDYKKMREQTLSAFKLLRL